MDLEGSLTHRVVCNMMILHVKIYKTFAYLLYFRPLFYQESFMLRRLECIRTKQTPLQRVVTAAWFI